MIRIVGLLAWMAFLPIGALVSVPALSAERCVMGPCLNGKCAYEQESETTCRCPAGTTKRPVLFGGENEHGATLCPFNAEGNSPQCQWNFECARAGRQQ